MRRTKAGRLALVGAKKAAANTERPSAQLNLFVTDVRADLISASKGIAVVDIPWSYGEIMIRQYGSVNGIAMAMNAGAGMPPQVERNVKIPVTAVEPRSSAYRHCE